MANSLKTPAGQVEYEIYLLKSQAECLLNDLDNGKAPKTFKDNLPELKKLSSIILALIHTIEKEI